MTSDLGVEFRNRPDGRRAGSQCIGWRDGEIEIEIEKEIERGRVVGALTAVWMAFYDEAVADDFAGFLA
jgi:hypothetical protein